LFQLFDSFGVFRADWLVAAAGIRSLQSTNHRSRNRERGATVISFTHEVPLRSSWNVTAETVPRKSIHDIDGPSVANLRSIVRYVELKELPIMRYRLDGVGLQMFECQEAAHAWTETPSGAIVQNSDSGTASSFGVSRPMRARYPRPSGFQPDNKVPDARLSAARKLLLVMTAPKGALASSTF
jgi:hypothetical protein